MASAWDDGDPFEVLDWPLDEGGPWYEDEEE
jgi:hypothetical protein